MWFFLSRIFYGFFCVSFMESALFVFKSWTRCTEFFLLFCHHTFPKISHPLPFPHPKREPLVHPQRDFIFLPRNVTWFYKRPSSPDLRFWNSGEILWSWLLIEGHKIWGFWQKWADAFVATDFCVTWFSRKFHCFIFCVTKSWIWPILNFCVFDFVFPLWAQSDFCCRVDYEKIRDQRSSGRTMWANFKFWPLNCAWFSAKAFSRSGNWKNLARDGKVEVK